jgi:hypothetical protein
MGCNCDALERTGQQFSLEYLGKYKRIDAFLHEA